MDEFKIDISEDYDDLKDDEDFIHLLGESFSLEDAKIEQEPLVNEELLKGDCDIEFDNVEDVLSDIESVSSPEVEMDTEHGRS